MVLEGFSFDNSQEKGCGKTTFLDLKPQDYLSLRVLVEKSEDLPPQNSEFFVASHNSYLLSLPSASPVRLPFRKGKRHPSCVFINNFFELMKLLSELLSLARFPEHCSRCTNREKSQPSRIRSKIPSKRTRIKGFCHSFS